MAIDYEKLKAEVEETANIDVETEVAKLRAKLKNLSKEGAILILANKAGIKVKPETPKSTIKTIDTLREGDDFVEIAGASVNVYDLKFYEVCSSCAKRIREQSGVWKCDQHGVVPPAYSYLWNVQLDDGTGSIRVTLFSKQIERLLGMNAQQVLKFRENPASFSELKDDVLGKLLAFRGKVKRNAMTNKLEFTANMVFKEPKDVTPRTEAITNLINQGERIHKASEEQDTLIDDIDIEEESIR